MNKFWEGFIKRAEDGKVEGKMENMFQTKPKPRSPLDEVSAADTTIADTRGGVSEGNWP